MKTLKLMAMNALHFVFVYSESAMLGYKLITKTYNDKQIVESRILKFIKVAMIFFFIYIMRHVASGGEAGGGPLCLAATNF